MENRNFTNTNDQEDVDICASEVQQEESLPAKRPPILEAVEKVVNILLGWHFHAALLLGIVVIAVLKAMGIVSGYTRASVWAQYPHLEIAVPVPELLHTAEFWLALCLAFSIASVCFRVVGYFGSKRASDVERASLIYRPVSSAVALLAVLFECFALCLPL